MHKVTHDHPDVWGGERSIEDCLNRWTSDIELTGRHAEKSDHHVVRYCDVAQAPDRTLRRLCSALGLGHAESVIEGYKEEAETVTLGFEEWKRANTDDIQYRGHEKFNRRFDRIQKRKIENVVSDYDLDTLTTL